MKITQISCILMVTLLLTGSSDVMASDFSCGARIITIGAYKYDVLRKCGEPSHVEVREEVMSKETSDPGYWKRKWYWIGGGRSLARDLQQLRNGNKI